MQYKRYGLRSLICFVSAALCWFIGTVLTYEMLFVMAAIICFVLGICFAVIFVCAVIAVKKEKDISVPKIFAVADIGIGLLVLAYAVYDIHTGSGIMAGLAGVLLLLLVVPAVLILLIADIVYVVVKNRKKKGIKHADNSFD